MSLAPIVMITVVLLDALAFLRMALALLPCPVLLPVMLLEIVAKKPMQIFW